MQQDIEHALLGFLYRKPMHGYEIHQQLRSGNGLGLVWRLNQGQLYALLAKLESRGAISATLEPQDTRPPRRILHLTPAGRQAFLDWLQAPVSRGRQMRIEFMAKVYSARQVGPQVALSLVEKQRGACQVWKAALQVQADALPEDQVFERLVYQYRIGQIEAALSWLAVCEQALSAAP